MSIMLMGIAEYARERNISQKMIRKLISNDEIAAGKCHGKWLLDVERVDEYFRNLTTPHKQAKQKQEDFLEKIKALKAEGRRKRA